jgi:Ran GTPase-activating protein (RanGAP) involved in mRNA processing and transport
MFSYANSTNKINVELLHPEKPKKLRKRAYLFRFGKRRIDRMTITGQVDSPGNTTEIRLFEMNIGDDRVVEIAETLQNNRYIQVLNLSKNVFGDDGLQALAQAFTTDTALERVVLGDNPYIGVRGLTALGEALGTPTTTIQALSLTNCGLGNLECHVLSSSGLGLESNIHLQELLLHSNLIGDQGVTTLAHALKTNVSLKVLDLSDNPIGDDGWRGLYEGLRGNQHLTHLFVNDNRVSAYGLQQMVYLADANASLLALHTKTHSHATSKTSTIITPEQEALLELMEFYLLLNTKGRLFLRQNPAPNLLPLVLARISNQAHVLYAIIREVPHLLHS